MESKNGFGALARGFGYVGSLFLRLIYVKKRKLNLTNYNYWGGVIFDGIQ